MATPDRQADMASPAAADAGPKPSGVLRPVALDPAREAVVRLSRAVQRAAIYPTEHPSVRLALGPFLEVLHQVIRTQRRLLLVVMRDRLVVSAGDETPREHQSRWLASQLYGRRITSLTFDAELDAAELLGFIHWLAQPSKESTDAPPALPGLRFTRLDYSRAQFDPTPRAPSAEAPEAIAAWNALAVGLLSPGSTLAPSETPIDPARIANAIEADLAAAEGTGVSSVTGRLIKAGGGIAALPDAERHAIRDRLAAVVSALPQEIRRQILATLPQDDPRKIDLLIEILDALPRDRLLELVPRVDMTPGAHVRQFLTFLVKLVSLAHSDPAVGEAMEAQLGRHGLPIELMQTDTDSAQRLLDELFTQRIEQFTSTGELYQTSLQELCAGDTGQRDALDLARYGRPESHDEVSAHVAHIALHLLRADPRSASTAACLVRVREVARQDLDSGRIDLLAELASAIDGLPATQADAATRALMQECLTLCREPRAAARLMSALEGHIGPAYDALTALFVASGPPVAALAIGRISDLPDGPLRDRLGHLLARLELGVVREAVSRAHAEGVSVSRLLAVFRELDPARTPDLARIFIHDADPAVRREALEVLSEAPLAPVKRERVMLRALNDDDPGVVRVALRQLSMHQTAPGLAALTEFLARTHNASLEPLQTYAVQALRQTGTPKVVEALAPALLARRRAFDPAARRVSRAIAAALDEAGDDRARTAARTWRRSPAGVWSACRGDRAEAAS